MKQRQTPRCSATIIPGSQWYSDAYALVTGEGPPRQADEGWFGRIVGSVF